MKIYDLTKNAVIMCPDHIARLRLRAMHISKGGRYCLPQEVERYVVTPNLQGAEIVQQKPSVEVTDEPDLVADPVTDEPKKRRKKKTELDG